MRVCALHLPGGEIKGEKNPRFCSESYNWQGREVGHLYANRAVRIKLACLVLCSSASTTDQTKREKEEGKSGGGRTLGQVRITDDRG